MHTGKVQRPKDVHMAAYSAEFNIPLSCHLLDYTKLELSFSLVMVRGTHYFERHIPLTILLSVHLLIHIITSIQQEILLLRSFRLPSYFFMPQIRTFIPVYVITIFS